LLKAQVLALILFSFLSGSVPGEKAIISPLSLMGFHEPLDESFLVGTWVYSDEFFKWGITDKEKSRIRASRNNSGMILDKDGSMRMVNFFKPERGKWELSNNNIAIYDPKFPYRAAQILPVLKRDENRIWVLLPFTNGSSGIGMQRAKEDDLLRPVSNENKTIEPKRTYRPERSQPRASWPSDPVESSFPSTNSDGFTRREFTDN
jgi:hypothetical protein